MKLFYFLLLISSTFVSSKFNNDNNLSIINQTKFDNGIENFINNCIQTLIHIHYKPLLSTNCCLTNLCSNKWLVKSYPTIKELTFKLCSERSYLLKEQLNGCKNQTNYFIKKQLNKGNCKKKFGTPIINYKIGSDDNNLTSFSLATIPTNNVQMPNIQTNAKEIRFENNTKTSARNSSLQFLDVPKGDELRIHGLKLNEQYLLFEAFSTLIGYLQPSEFPSELIRNAIENQIPFHIFALQLLKTEIVAVGWFLLWALLSICLPFVIVAQLCCMNTNIERLNEDSSNVSLSFSDKCTERTFGFLLHFLLVLFLFPLILILAGNEQISKYITMSTTTTNLIFDDVNNFIKNTHMQITFVAISSTDIAIEAIRKDLEDINNILGKPVQDDLATEFGIDKAFNKLEELKMMIGKVTTLVTDLVNECALAQTAGSRLQEQMREIARQLTIARQQCLPKDRTLCYTLQYTGFDATFSTVNITNDQKIKQLASIGSEMNFNNSIEKAQTIFSQVPEQVALGTTPYVAEIKTVLSKKRTEVYKSAHKLDELSRSITESVKAGHHSALQLIEKASTWDLWRWLIVVGISTILSLVWCLLLCGAPCGCGITSRTIPFLLAGVSLSCIISLVVWSLGTLSYLAGAHCQSFICQTFYDSPHYKALGKLVDSNGILSNDNVFFSSFIKQNDSIQIADVLRNCQRNQPIYTTFHLKNLFNVQTLTNHKSWTDLINVFSNFTILENNLEILSPQLQLNLQLLLSTISTINLTTYRLKMIEPLTKKDLNSFADQLNSVAIQLSDLRSSKRIDNLAFQIKKIIENNLKELNDLRNKILYKITNLEVLIYPLYKKTNESLIELKNIQYYLDNEGWQITERNNRKFIGKIENYLNDLYNHTTYKITKDIGKCRPLWEIYHSLRFYFCKLLVDPMNGISLLSFLLILLFWGIVPTVIKLIEHYKELNEELLSSITHRRARDGLIIDDEGTWATPSSDSPDIITHTSGDQPGQSRQPSVPFIPPPPRPPSNISSRITSPRIPQIPSVSKATSSRRFSNIASKISAVSRVPQIQSRARSPKRGWHESLHLIDPICWKSGSITPKSWL